MRRALPASADDCRLRDLHLIPNGSRRAIDLAADLVANFVRVAGRTGWWQPRARRRETDPVKSALPGAAPRSPSRSGDRLDCGRSTAAMQ